VTKQSSDAPQSSSSESCLALHSSLSMPATKEDAVDVGAEGKGVENGREAAKTLFSGKSYIS